MKKSKSIFVTGGSGFVGQNILPILIDNEYEVYCLARSQQAKQKITSLGGIPIQGDLANLADDLIPTLKKCDYVVHIAAYMNFTVDPKPYYTINVEATRSLLQLAKKSGIRSFIYISAAPVISGSPVVNATEDDDDSTLPISLYPKTKAIAERAVLAANSSKFRTLSLRPPAIWGPNNHHYNDLLENVKNGKWRWLNGGNHVLSTIHVKNLGQAILAALNSSLGGKAYFVTDGDRRTVKETFTQLLNAEGLDPGNKELPLWIASPIATVVNTIWKTFRLKTKPPVAPLMIRLMGREFSVSDGLARKELSYRNAISFREGIEEIKQLKAQGK